MNLTRPSEVRTRLEEIGLRPSKSLGQNFLVDGNILRIMLEAAALSRADTVLEIGPGLGVLTEGLLAAAGRVIAVEKDARLCKHLEDRFAAARNLELIHSDVMDVPVAELLDRGVNKLVANLPYSVGTRALLELAESGRPPPLMAVTVQHDVAERLGAAAATAAYGTASILVQSRYAVRIVKAVSPTCFYPPPRVRSAIVALRRLGPEAAEPRDRAHFRALVRSAFMHRRKQLGTVLRGLPAGLSSHQTPADRLLAGLGLDPKQRPESLTVDQWRALSDAIAPR
jgi:16S rRNA (adenine1518-N6/adenine1519-N6)-dimethyltransferase